MLPKIIKKAEDLGETNVNLLDLAKNVLAILQQGRGFNTVKILTPQQMLTRLPILSAQIQAGDNSQKLKNEARQL